VVIGLLRAIESQRRMLFTDELAEGVELETNTLRVLLRGCAQLLRNSSEATQVTQRGREFASGMQTCVIKISSSAVRQIIGSLRGSAVSAPHGAPLAWSPDAREVLVILMIVKKAGDLAFQRRCLL
jgi:hypothetical protein